MDIVYTLKQSETNEEFFYSLRSLCNLPHDRVYIVGGVPYNVDLNRVHYIPTKKLETKYKTTTQNLIVAANIKELSDDFIWMNDDFYILQKIENPVVELALHYGTINSVIDMYMRRIGHMSRYIEGAKTTLEYLNTLGIKEPLSYELHIPIIYNKHKVLEMFELPGIKDIPVLYKRSVYGNIYNIGGAYTSDVKILNKTPVDDTILNTMKFLSSSDFTWVKIKSHIQTKFEKKCKYEL